MSRYAIAHPTLEIAVGWDNPMGTLFAFVADPALPEEDEVVMWIGNCFHDKITSVQTIREALKPYAKLPDDIAKRIQIEMDESTGPTPLQQYINALMNDIDRTKRMS